MASLSGTPIKAAAMRIIKLDACGTPVTGAGSGVVVTKGWISLAQSPQYQEGTEYTQMNVAGELCVNDKDSPAFKRHQLTLTWCIFCPDAVSLISGEDLLTTGSATGSGIAYGEGLVTARYSIEVWTPMAGAGACDPSGQQQFAYFGWPNVGNTMIGDSTIEQAPYQFTSTSETKAISPLWQTRVGASAWLGSNVLASDRHSFTNITTTAPPAVPENCGAVAL